MLTRHATNSLRRRFEQNQEDCTFTVLALLPTATAHILEAMNTEKITYDIQQMKGSAVARARSIGSTSPPSISETNATDDDGRSIITVSAQSEAGVHTTQLSVPTPLAAAAPGTGTADAPQESLLAPPKPRKTKRQLWDELTISCEPPSEAPLLPTRDMMLTRPLPPAITRSYTLLYTLGLLTMLTRIQLNLLGRRSYLSSVVSLASGGGAAPGTISLENNDDDSAELAYGTDFDVNRKYLTFSWWLLNRGWVDVMQRVDSAVRQVFGHLSPRDTVTLETFSKLGRDVRGLIEGTAPPAGAGANWLPFLLPTPDMEDFVLRESGVLDSAPEGQPTQTTPPTSPSSAASLRRLLDETADLIESPTFSNVLSQLLDAGFAILHEQKLPAGIFDTPSTTATPTASTISVAPSIELYPPGSARAVLLPKILSVVTRQAHAIGNGAMPNEYLRAMEGVPDLEGFAAVVYSSNWQAEIVTEEGGRPAVVAVPGTAGGEKTRGGEGTTQEGTTTQGLGEESLVLVGEGEAESGLFDSVWAKASASGEGK